MNKNALKIFCTTLAWAALVAGCATFLVEWFRPGYVDAFIPVWVPWVVAALAALTGETL